MEKDFASTLAELVTYPITVVTDVVDWAMDTPPHERLSSIVKTEVFMDSHFRNLDKVSGDRNLYVGDVMRVVRSLAGTIPYYHYCIYVGAGEVIHFTGGGENSQPSENVIKRTSTEMFFKDAEMMEILKFPAEIHHENSTFKTFPPASAAKRANTRLGELNYDLATNNCEHFVMWCRTGIEFSSQVLGARDFILSILLPVGFQPGIVGLIPKNPFIPIAAKAAAAAALANSTAQLAKFGIEVSRSIFSSNCLGT